MIEDEELRELFKLESEDHIQEMTEGLLTLEKQPDDMAALDSIYRKAHIIKGSAVMVGEEDIVKIAHLIEEYLSQVKDGKVKFTSKKFDLIYEGLDAIRPLVKEAIYGIPADVNIDAVLARLQFGVDDPSDSEMVVESSFEITETIIQEEITVELQPEFSPDDESLMIEDEELRELFKLESEDHIQEMTEGLLTLEKKMDDIEALDLVYRKAHIIKGSAVMVGRDGIVKIAHLIEEYLAGVKNGKVKFSPQKFDLIYEGVDAIRPLVKEAIYGTPANIDLQKVLARLQFGVEDSSDLDSPVESVSEVNEAKIDNEIPVEVVSEKQISRALDAANKILHKETSQSPTINPSAKYTIDTVRVDTKTLDDLITHTGELAVTKLRIDKRFEEFDEMLFLLDEWKRKSSYRKRIFEELEKNSEKSSTGFKAELGEMENIWEEEGELFVKISSFLDDFKNFSYEDNARLEFISKNLDAGIRKIRLVQLSAIFNLFPRTVRDLARQTEKEIELVIEGGETTADKRIVEEIKDPLIHIIRNAIDHGLEKPEDRINSGKPTVGTIQLRAYQTATSIMIEVIDDGRGLNIESIKKTALKRNVCTPEALEKMDSNQIQELIFTPAFSTSNIVTEISGRGVGMDIVKNTVENLKGKIKLESRPGLGCTFQLSLPFTLATIKTLIVVVNGVNYAMPTDHIETMLTVKKGGVFPIEGRQTINFNDKPLSVTYLFDLLELKEMSKKEPHEMPCIVISSGGKRVGLFVDSILGDQEIVLKPQCKLLKRVRNISGAAILGTGDVCKVLNPIDLIKSVGKKDRQLKTPLTSKPDSRKKRLLLADDSLTVRAQEKKILEKAGYEVIAAVDGLDAFNKLKLHKFDGVVSDVEMPNMTGLALAENIRKSEEYADLPIVLVTSLAKDEDKARGAKAGANAYITKGSFDQKVLLEVLDNLI
jgi:two-component system, chemotaxis family, sensor kinase CheA